MLGFVFGTFATIPSIQSGQGPLAHQIEDTTFEHSNLHMILNLCIYCRLIEQRILWNGGISLRLESERLGDESEALTAKAPLSSSERACHLPEVSFAGSFPTPATHSPVMNV